MSPLVICDPIKGTKLLADCLLLGWIGCQPVEAPYVTIGQIASVGFLFYFAITPNLGKLEARLIQNSNVCERFHLFHP